MSVSVASEPIRFAVPPTFAIHRKVLQPDGVAAVRDFVARTLGGRAAVGDGEQDENWSVDFRTLMADGRLQNPSELVRVVKKSSVPTLCREIFGPGLAYSVDKSLIRDFNPGRRPVPAAMHFDAHVFGPHVPMVTVWVPLNAVGVDSPGLAVATRPHWPRQYWTDLTDCVDSNGLYRRIPADRRAYSQDEIYALARKEPEWPIVEPVLDVGDVMIFDHQHIHGTQPGIAEPKRRMSMEIRVLPMRVVEDLMKGGLQQYFGKLD